jgi:acetate kinase
VRRYGFHGTSHRYVPASAIKKLTALGMKKEDTRVITATSATARAFPPSKGGKCMDTFHGTTAA